MVSATSPSGKVTSGGTVDSGTINYNCFNESYINSINLRSVDTTSGWIWVAYEFKSPVAINDTKFVYGSQGGGVQIGYEVKVNGSWITYLPDPSTFVENVEAIKFKIYNNVAIYRSFIYNCQCTGYYM